MSQSTDRPRVLVVVEDPLDAGSLCRALSQDGFDPVYADSEAEGLSLLQSRGPVAAAVVDASARDQRAFITRLNAARPGIAVVAMLGDSPVGGEGATNTVAKQSASNALSPLLFRLLATRQTSAPTTSSSSAAATDDVAPLDEQPLTHRFATAEQFSTALRGELGRGSLFVPHASPLPVATPITLELALPGGRTRQFHAEVRATFDAERAAATGKPAGMVLKLDMSNAARDELMKLGSVTAPAPAVRPAAASPITAPRAPFFNAPSAPKAATAPTMPEASTAKSLLQALQAYLAFLQATDYFGVLDVREGVSPEELRMKYLELAKRLHPSRYALEAPEVKQTAAEAFILVQKANETLSDASLLAQYRAQIGAAKPPTKNRPSIVALDALRRAQATRRSGEMLAARRDTPYTAT